MNNNMVNQAATLRTDGVPNDVINNMNPLSLIVFIPSATSFFTLYSLRWESGSARLRKSPWAS